MESHLGLPVRIQLLTEAFAQMKEAPFTLTVLVPLFQSLGYRKVDYHGGPDEGGKDLICWGLDEIGETRLTVVQVKRYRVTAKAADPHNFSEVVTQLSQAVEKPVPNIDGIAYLPTTVYFITPFIITTRALQTRFEGLQALKHRNVKVLDGAKIAELLCNRLPHIASKLLGPIGELKWANREHLSNTVLLSALDYNKHKDLKQIYTDIDLSMGHNTTRLFFGSHFSGHQMRCVVTPDDWNAFKTAVSCCRDALSIELLAPTVDLDSLDQEFCAEWQQYRDYKNMSSQHDNTLRNTCENLSTLVRFIHEYHLMSKSELRTTPEKSVTRIKLNRYLESLDACMDELFRLSSATEFSKPIDATNTIATITAIAAECKDTAIAQMIDEDDKGEVFQDVLTKSISYFQILVDTVAARLNIPVVEMPQRTFVVDGRFLAQYLENERNAILRTLPEMKDSEWHAQPLKKFLTHSKSVIDVAQTVLASNPISESVGVSNEQLYALDRTHYRFSCPLKAIIDTGVNILILGEAGAGKTTSMQMYALNRLENSTLAIPLLIPLASMLRTWKEHESFNGGRNSDLLEGIVCFFSKHGATIPADSLRELLSNECSILLLDGIDEVVKSIPWIVDCISELTRTYPNIQVVASSRSSGDYVDTIPFISVTLLPFNVSQRAHFIKAWFGSDGQHHVKHVAEHLENNPSVAEVANNPLLATVMCTLEESDVRLPDTEVMLYEERMRLLLGDYDIKKGISRLKTRRHILELVSRKVAMELHTLGHREEHIEWYYGVAAKVLEGKGEYFNPETVVNELLDPCNILVPMSDVGQVGYGHLRYQEYLVAKELNMNRYQDLYDYIRSPWWRGVFELLAQMTDNFEQLLYYIYRPEKYDQIVETVVHSMISARPVDEQPSLRVLAEQMASSIYKTLFPFNHN